MAKIIVLGYQGKRTAFSVYCRTLIAELGITHTPRKNVAGVTVLPGQAAPAVRYVSKSDVCNYLWSGKEINADDLEYIVSKYPQAPSFKDFQR